MYDARAWNSLSGDPLPGPPPTRSAVPQNPVGSGMMFQVKSSFISRSVCFA